MYKTISNPKPVKLFIGMLSNDVLLFEKLKGKLEGIFGLSDMTSPVREWNHTGYYSKEMGEGLRKQFIFFQRLIDPGLMPDIKIKTVKLESEYLNKSGGRRINLDPGYLDSAKVVLVSTKDYSHRIYLGKDIYGEVTLIYSGKTYQTLPYTYPDFRTEEYLDIFKKARRIYNKDIKSLKNLSGIRD